MDKLSTQLTLGMLVPYILEWLKGQKWFPAMGPNNPWLNRIVAAIIAGAAGFGITGHFESSAGVLTITGLTLANIQQGLFHSVLQYLLQHTVYKTAIVANQPKTPAQPPAQP